MALGDLGWGLVLGITERKGGAGIEHPPCARHGAMASPRPLTLYCHHVMQRVLCPFSDEETEALRPSAATSGSRLHVFDGDT